MSLYIRMECTRQTSAPPLPLGGCAGVKWKRWRKDSRAHESIQTEPCVCHRLLSCLLRRRKRKALTITSRIIPNMSVFVTCGGGAGVLLVRPQLRRGHGDLASESGCCREWVRHSSQSAPPPRSSSEPPDVPQHFLLSVRPVGHYPRLFLSLSHTHTYTHTNRHTRTHARMHTRTHAHTHTHTHTHTYTRV